MNAFWREHKLRCCINGNALRLCPCKAGPVGIRLVRVLVFVLVLAVKTKEEKNKQTTTTATK